MQAVILAAGESSRFWPLNNNHKSQIKILGKSLIYWTIKGIIAGGVKKIIIICGANSLLEKELNDEGKLNVKIDYVVQKQPLGTGNAIFQAKNMISEPFFVLWPYKIYSKEIIKKFLAKQNLSKDKIILAGSRTATPWDYGILKFNGKKIIGICENPKKGKEPSNIKLIGNCFLYPDFFTYYQKIKKHHPEDFIDALDIYLKNKETEFVVLEKEFFSLKYPWELLAFLKPMFESENFKPFISKTAKIAKSVVIKNNVYIGDGAEIGENTIISGPCFIGDNCKIGVNNVIRGPVNLEKEIITGAFAEIKNSLIQEGTHLHSGFFGDSVIGKNCRFGAGFITANRRIDRKNIKSTVKGKKLDTGLTYLGAMIGDNSCFGIQSGTMPGVLIGSNSVVGPGSLVFKNIKNNSRLFKK